MNELLSIEFIKSGVVTTNLSGIANIVFKNQIPYGLNYSVLLTCVDPGNAVFPSPSKISQTGFTITTKTTSGAYNIVPTVTVHWLIVPQFNS